MTWIKTVRMDEDERVKYAMESQRKLYPIEYATPVAVVDDAGEAAGIVASHTLAARRSFPCLQHVWRFAVSRFAADTPPTRNDCHHGVGHQPLPLLNRVTRRVSASRNTEQRNG